MFKEYLPNPSKHPINNSEKKKDKYLIQPEDFKIKEIKDWKDKNPPFLYLHQDQEIKDCVVNIYDVESFHLFRHPCILLVLFKDNKRIIKICGWYAATMYSFKDDDIIKDKILEKTLSEQDINKIQNKIPNFIKTDPRGDCILTDKDYYYTLYIECFLGGIDAEIQNIKHYGSYEMYRRNRYYNSLKELHYSNKRIILYNFYNKSKYYKKFLDAYNLYDVKQKNNDNLSDEATNLLKRVRKYKQDLVYANMNMDEKLKNYDYLDLYKKNKDAFIFAQY